MGAPMQSRVSPEQVKCLAALAGLAIPGEQCPSLAARLQSMRDGAATLANLPLQDVEPATVFKPAA